MKKSIRIIIPIIILIIFIAMMTSDIFLKQPMTGDDDFLHLVDNVELEVMNENWEQADLQLEKTKHAWEKIVTRVQFSIEKDEIVRLHKLLERTGGYIKAQDKGGAIAELAEARHIWSDIGE